MKCRMFFAGSGGQGTLLIGQMISKAAMEEGNETTYLPSYGPEMRGGTANCTVIVSDAPIACPLINECDMLVAMNKPSMEKFESMVVPGGYMFYNASVIDVAPSRNDIQLIPVDCVAEAAELGSEKAANIVMLGAIIAKMGIVNVQTVEHMLEKTFSGTKAKYLDMNMKAVHLHDEK